MTIYDDKVAHRAVRAGSARAVGLPLLAAAGLVLWGCAGPREPGAASNQARVYAADIAGGAKHCVVPKVSLSNAQATDTVMTVGNDGGWCAITVSQKGKPYDTYLLTVRPQHGHILTHSVGDTTRIDYTPDRGYTGADRFSLKLIPGDPVIHVSVTVAGS